MKATMLDFKTVYECNHCLGCKTLHPQVSIINLANPNLKQDTVKFEFYAVLLIEECPDDCCCGRKHYDYSNATMVFLAPGEIFRMSKSHPLPDKGYLLTFHPDLLFRTSLKNHIKNYTFFAYHKEEALHLSQRETTKIICCLENIEDELRHPIDTYSSTILSHHIELLLDYCTRYYERQFITRENKNKIIFEKMERFLNQYIDSGKLREGTLPTSELCAENLGLSTAYFNDLIKFETGNTFQEYFQFKRLETARKMLLKGKDTPYSIACQLGYSNIGYFNLIFKKIMGTSPIEYK